jgi:hypothetical protein
LNGYRRDCLSFFDQRTLVWTLNFFILYVFVAAFGFETHSGMMRPSRFQWRSRLSAKATLPAGEESPNWPGDSQGSPGGPVLDNVKAEQIQSRENGGRTKPTESATEKKPPGEAIPQVRVKWCGKSAPRSEATRAARQTPPAARPNSGNGSQDPRPQPGTPDPRVGCGDENPEARGNARSREMIASAPLLTEMRGNKNRLTRGRDTEYEAGRFRAPGFDHL